jgi:hypothetical protein
MRMMTVMKDDKRKIAGRVTGMIIQRMHMSMFLSIYYHVHHAHHWFRQRLTLTFFQGAYFMTPKSTLLVMFLLFLSLLQPKTAGAT